MRKHGPYTEYSRYFSRKRLHSGRKTCILLAGCGPSAAVRCGSGGLCRKNRCRGRLRPGAVSCLPPCLRADGGHCCQGQRGSMDTACTAVPVSVQGGRRERHDICEINFPGFAAAICAFFLTIHTHDDIRKSKKSERIRMKRSVRICVFAFVHRKATLPRKLSRSVSRPASISFAVNLCRTDCFAPVRSKSWET